LKAAAWARQWGVPRRRIRAAGVDSQAGTRCACPVEMTAVKEKGTEMGHYLKLGVNLAISTVIMYFVMFTMIDGVDDFYNNLNMFYMALMMVAPMGILMVLMMGSMYNNKRLNLGIYGGLAALFVIAFIGIRTQAAIGDVQFVRSMIPHHSGAILMCREASISDGELNQLCSTIQRTQREEIEQMHSILARLRQG
jgi:hypothetical protein